VAHRCGAEPQHVVGSHQIGLQNLVERLKASWLVLAVDNPSPVPSAARTMNQRPQGTELLCCVDGGLHAGFVFNVGRHESREVTELFCCLLAVTRGQVHDGDRRAEAGQPSGCCSTQARSPTGDEGRDTADIHDFLP
jgi:hypothetical protein